MRRALGRGRRGPACWAPSARTAVAAGTATAVSGRGAAAGIDDGWPVTVDGLHAQLTKLGELRQAGLLTDEEFAAQRPGC